jgi:hypothetical protein
VGNFTSVKEPLGLNNAAYEVVRQAKLQDVLVKDEDLDHDGAPPRCCSMDPKPSERFVWDSHLRCCPMLRLHRLTDGVASWVDLEINNNGTMEQGQGPSTIYADESESKEEARARVYKRIGKRMVWNVDTEAVDILAGNEGISETFTMEDVADRHVNSPVPHVTGGHSDDEIDRQLATLGRVVNRICGEVLTSEGRVL